jgi:hypothetical protein
MDMCLQLPSPTARMIWVHLGNLFNGNKPSHAVHLECELHNLTQGEMSANDYCHRLQQLANSLADCDAPISDRALVHQLIQCVEDSASTSSEVPYIEAHELILSAETSRPMPSAPPRLHSLPLAVHLQRPIHHLLLQ